MAYSELVKSLDRIRDYMRQFYVYGFKSRSEYDAMSARSYDNERRRMESWLGDYMRFRQGPDGKRMFLSVDSRSIPANPLYNAFKAKSFTAGDVTFHFYILDLLRGRACIAQEVLDLFWEKYLNRMESAWQPDLSTIRKKLKEYVALGLLEQEKRGREVVFRRSQDAVELDGWADAVAFFSEADPVGVVGSFLLDRMEEKPDRFRFKHHYILHAMDSQVLLQLLTAIGEKRRVRLSCVGGRGGEHSVCPMKIYISTQGGRQYLLCHHRAFHKMMFFRLDNIRSVRAEEPEPDFEGLREACGRFQAHLWGTSGGRGFRVEHLEMTVRYGPGEEYISRRLEREKRNGRVEYPGEGLCRFTADVYDAQELLPWLRTFTGRIVKLECSNRAVTEQFYEDLRQMYALYGGESHAVQ